MTDKKKENALGADTTESEARIINQASSDNSLPQYSTDQGGKQERSICEYLWHGEENAISSKDLMRSMGCSSVRDLRNIVASERMKGAVILSTTSASGGYYLPSGGEKGRKETQRFVATMDARRNNISLSTKSAREFLKILDGQTQMEDTDEQGREEEVQ